VKYEAELTMPSPTCSSVASPAPANICFKKAIVFGWSDSIPMRQLVKALPANSGSTGLHVPVLPDVCSAEKHDGPEDGGGEGDDAEGEGDEDEAATVQLPE
jgi:hypothetical protein